MRGRGEGRRGRAEDLLLREGLQVSAEGGLDVAHLLAPLHALEGVDEVARQLLHREPIRALVEGEGLRVRVRVGVRGRVRVGVRG